MKAKQYTATAQQVFRIFGPGDLYATASDIDEALRMGGKMLPIHPQQYRALRRELATSGSTLWYHGVDATYIDTVRMPSPAKVFGTSAVDENGHTPLMCAARNGDLAEISALIKAGADVHTRDKDGWTALFWSTLSGCKKTVSALIDAGACVNAVDDEGWTALMHATYEGRDGIGAATTLLHAGANVNAQNKAGRTALMLAVLVGCAEVIPALIQAGADLALKNKSGSTAEAIATECGHSKIAKMLRTAKTSAEKA